MSKGLHRFALFVAAATFFLIVAGANVTSRDAGLSVPDWPLSFGKFFPEMVGNVFWEHGHRMIAASAGFFCILLAVGLQIRDPRVWIKRLGWILLAGFIVQGLFGGLTVRMKLPLAVSATHATLAQLIFLTTVSLAVFTSRSWTVAAPNSIEETDGLSVRALCIASLTLILVQLVLGATLRHSASWDQFLPTGLLVAHISGAIVVTLSLGVTAFTILMRHREEKFLTRPAIFALALLFVQLLLGLGSYVVRSASPYDPQPLNPMVAVTVAHVACGALVFATAAVMTLRVFRVLRAEHREYVLAPA